MDKLPAIILMMVLGIKKGDILRGPPAWYAASVFSIIDKPPIPEPILTPMRSESRCVTSSIPASLTA